MEDNLINHQENEESVINLKMLFSILWDNLLRIIIISVVATGIITVVLLITYTPKYSSTATMYILKSEGATTTTSDISLANYVLYDSQYVVSSSSVIKDALEETGLANKYSVETLSKAITSKNPTNTRFLEVTVEANTPEDSAKLVNAICEIAKEEMTAHMHFDFVNITESGAISTNPSNRIAIYIYLVIFVGSFAAAYALFFGNYLFNDILKTDDDFLKRLGHPVLGSLPDIVTLEKGKYRRYKKYGKYGSYKSYGYYAHETQRADDLKADKT